VAVVKSLDVQNKYDRTTRRILKELQPVGIEACIHQVDPVGRAAENLRRYFSKELLEGPCHGDPILENPLKDPHCITIEPSGEARAPLLQFQL
jgi:hypothetical protein